MEFAIYVAGGTLVILGIVRRTARAPRARINVTPLSDQWLAEQRLTRHSW